MPDAAFKSCPCCGAVWPTREEFLSDPSVSLLAYQVNLGELEAGLFLFNHRCGTTLSIDAERFLDLAGGPLFEQIEEGATESPPYCLEQHPVKPCPGPCECRYVNDVLQVIRNWPKRPDDAPDSTA